MSKVRRRRWVPLLLALAGCIGVALFPLAPALAGANTYWLNPNETLPSGQRLVSTDGQYVMVMQGDGNLVVYAPGNRPIWASGTGVGGSDLTMQGDGNLVVYTPPRPNRVAVWASGTSGGLRLELQTDGNFVLYTTGGHTASWSGAGITDRNNVGRVKYNGYVSMRDRGWADSQWSCLDSLWTNESGWRWNAQNASSGAYGIPQALPATKMASAGADWHENPGTQIAWGLSYVSGTYGDPCRAWTLWQQRSPHWY
jgi:hypothetical protein